MDLKDMLDSEYMKVCLRYFPQDIVKKYNLISFVRSDGYVYIQIMKGRYRLKQAESNENLSKLLNHVGYFSIINNSECGNIILVKPFLTTVLTILGSSIITLQIYNI